MLDLFDGGGVETIEGPRISSAIHQEPTFERRRARGAFDQLLDPGLKTTTTTA